MGSGCSANHPKEVDISADPSVTAKAGEHHGTNGTAVVGGICGKETKVAIFSAAPYVHSQMSLFAKEYTNTVFIDATCGPTTAHLCAGATVVCLFVNDECGRDVIDIFASLGVKLITLRCAGFDRVDLEAAEEKGIKVTRVPAYSPYAVAEHAVALAMCLNRKIHRARNRVRDGNYNLNGLTGIDLNGKTAGIVGTGLIGYIAASIFKGLGLNVICYDVFKNAKITDLGCEYVEMDELYAQADIISLHVPLLESTLKMINKDSIAKMKKGVILINCSRGGLVSTSALIEGLVAGKLGAVGLDVYDKEQDLFFQDISTMEAEERWKKWDSRFALLRSFPNVLVTPHTAFLTQEALDKICSTTMLNMEEFITMKEELTNVVKKPAPKPAPAPGAPAAPTRKDSRAATRKDFYSLTADAADETAADAEQLPVVDADIRIAVFSAQPYVIDEMAAMKQEFPSTFFIEQCCTADNANLVNGAPIVNLFVNDDASRPVIEVFKEQGVKLITLRCAGFDRVDLEACAEAGIKVARVPAYSPHAVAEHAVSLFMTLNRKLHLAYNRVRESIFTLSGLVGMDCKDKVAGIAGTGLIGCLAAKAFKALGMKVIGYDKFPNDKFKDIGTYVELEELYKQADVISLHLPLLPATNHCINKQAIETMKDGVYLINCARGGLIDTKALIESLEEGKFGGVGLDVYENEADLFFQDFTSMADHGRLKSWDNMMAVLRSFPNVIITPHSAFLTQEALVNICNTTTQNVKEFLEGKEELTNAVKAK